MNIVTLANDSHKILRAKAVASNNEDGLKKLIQTMFEEMKKAKGIGLAANQIGDHRAVFVMNCDKNPLAFVNPSIVEKSYPVVSSEGCLSLPGELHPVMRYSKITVKARDADFKEFTAEFHGLEAYCVQHEMDHLNGVLVCDTPNKLMIEQ